MIKVVGPSLEQKNTNMRENILVKVIIKMILTKLGSGNHYKCVERSMALQKVWHPF